MLDYYDVCMFVFWSLKIVSVLIYFVYFQYTYSLQLQHELFVGLVLFPDLRIFIIYQLTRQISHHTSMFDR